MGRSAMAALALAMTLVIAAACGAVPAAPDADAPSSSPAGDEHFLPDTHGARELEALLPEELDDLELRKASFRGAAVAGMGFDEELLNGLLVGVGQSIDDVSVALAGDADGRVLVAAMRVEGVDAERVMNHFIDGNDAFEQRTIAGREVTAPDVGGIWFYPSDDVLFEVLGEDDLAEQAIARLP